ncbi:MAG: STAS domain-containing protein [Caldilineaceae bacterium]
MIMVSIGTFSWSSIRNLPVYPMTSNLVMIATVAVVVYTHNLAQGVAVGCCSALFFARRVSQLVAVRSELSADSTQRTYKVYGQIFFASADHFIDSFDFKEVIEHVVIDVSDAHLWDLTSVGALDKVILKFRREGTRVDVVGMNEASSTLVNRLAIHDKPEALEIMTDH